MIIYTDHKNITCKKVNAYRVLILLLILEEYSPYIEYIKGEKDVVSDALSRLPLNGNQETTQKSTYQKQIMSEINDIKELTEVTFPVF